MWNIVEIRGDHTAAKAELESLMNAISTAAKRLGLAGRAVFIHHFNSGEHDVFIPTDLISLVDDEAMKRFRPATVSQPDLYNATKVEV